MAGLCGMPRADRMGRRAFRKPFIRCILKRHAAFGTADRYAMVRCGMNNHTEFRNRVPMKMAAKQRLSSICAWLSQLATVHLHSMWIWYWADFRPKKILMEVSLSTNCIITSCGTTGAFHYGWHNGKIYTSTASLFAKTVAAFIFTCQSLSAIPIGDILSYCFAENDLMQWLVRDASLIAMPDDWSGPFEIRPTQIVSKNDKHIDIDMARGFGHCTFAISLANSILRYLLAVELSFTALQHRQQNHSTSFHRIFPHCCSS